MIKKIHWPKNNEENERFLKICRSVIPYFDYNDYMAVSNLITVDGEVAAVIAYSNFTGRNVEMHVGSLTSDWASRRLLTEIFHYPFVQMNVQRVTAIVDSTNHNTIDFIKRIGFTEEGLVRELYPDKRDGIVFGMLRRECKWLPISHDVSTEDVWEKMALRHPQHLIQ